MTLTIEQHIFLEDYLDYIKLGTIESWAEKNGYVSHNSAESPELEWQNNDGDYVDLWVELWIAVVNPVLVANGLTPVVLH